MATVYLYAVGYCISVCSNTWHVTMWDKRREGLEMLLHEMNSVDYGGGYIEKLDFFGSRGIMSIYCKYLIIKVLEDVGTMGSCFFSDEN